MAAVAKAAKWRHRKYERKYSINNEKARGGYLWPRIFGVAFSAKRLWRQMLAWRMALAVVSSAEISVSAFSDGVVKEIRLGMISP